MWRKTMSYNPLYVGSQALGSSVALVTNYTNSTASAIPQGVAVSSTGVADQIAPTDPTSDTSVHAFVGLAQARIPASSSGPVISGGRLEILTGYSFSIGNSIWMGLNGVPQSTRPDYGVTGFTSGDWVVFLGVVVQDEANPSDQDLQVIPQLIGQL
jgi:hypothetical protein